MKKTDNQLKSSMKWQRDQLDARDNTNLLTIKQLCESPAEKKPNRALPMQLVLQCLSWPHLCVFHFWWRRWMTHTDIYQPVL